jgi:uncharacterized damage-inducible protein DinB
LNDFKSKTMTRPTPNEHADFHTKYIALVPEGDYLSLLDENTTEIVRFFESIDLAKHDFRYAEGKWTVKDVLLHIVDTERGFSYRAIVCVRGDNQTLLAPMDEDLYAANANATRRSMTDLLDEFLAVRRSFRKIFETNSEETFTFLGNAAGYKISARALGYLGIGHALHHANIVRDRYL